MASEHRHSSTGASEETDDNDLSESERLAGEVAALQAENDRLREEFARLRQTQYQQTALALMGTGVVAAAGALFVPTARTILLALAGAGIFLGILTYYLAPEAFVAASLGRSVYETFATNVASLASELGLSETRYYVPVGDRPEVRLFVPQEENGSIPPAEALEETLVVTETSRGLATRPTGVDLYAEFDRAAQLAEDGSPQELLEGLADALVEQFELVEAIETTVAPETTSEAGAVTVGVTGSVYGPPDGFDHPVVSILAVGLARHLERPVETEVEGEEGDSPAARITCRWPVAGENAET